MLLPRIHSAGSFQREGYRGRQSLHDDEISEKPARPQPEKPERGVRGRLLPAQSGDTAIRSPKGRISEPHPRGIYVSRIGGGGGRRFGFRGCHGGRFSGGGRRAGGASAPVRAP